MVATLNLPYRVVCDGLAFPEGPVELPGGDILVTELFAGALTRITPQGNKTRYGYIGGGPNGAAIGPDGAIYVTQNGGMEGNGFNTSRFPWFKGDPPPPTMQGCIQRVTAGGEVSVLYQGCEGNRAKRRTT